MWTPCLTGFSELTGQKRIVFWTKSLPRAGPVIKRITNSAPAPQDALQETALRLIRMFRTIKADSGTKHIADILHYVAVVASSVRSEQPRESHPYARKRRDALEYTLSRDARFAVWNDDQRGRLCGLREWHQQPRTSPVGPRLVHLLAASRMVEDELPIDDPYSLSGAELFGPGFSN
jgi:hypothetical protein